MIIKPADIVMVRGSGFIDRAIEEITRSSYSHVAMVVKPSELVEAQAFRRTGFNGLDYYRGCSDIYTCDGLTLDQRQKIVAWIMGEVGTRYDYKLIAWEEMHFILHIDCPFEEDDRRHDCSQLVYDAYIANGLNPFPSAKIKYFVPGDFAKSAMFRRVGAFG